MWPVSHRHGEEGLPAGQRFFLFLLQQHSQPWLLGGLSPLHWHWTQQVPQPLLLGPGSCTPTALGCSQNMSEDPQWQVGMTRACERTDTIWGTKVSTLKKISYESAGFQRIQWAIHHALKNTHGMRKKKKNLTHGKKSRFRCAKILLFLSSAYVWFTAHLCFSFYLAPKNIARNHSVHCSTMLGFQSSSEPPWCDGIISDHPSEYSCPWSFCTSAPLHGGGVVTRCTSVF